jgi:hypothetical protein
MSPICSRVLPLHVVLVGLVIVAAAGGPALAEEPCTFTNEDVIKLVQAGLADSVILATMSRCRGAFDTSPDALVALKDQEVSEAIIAAMVNPPAPAPAPAAGATTADGAAAAADTPTLEELGTYVKFKNGQVRKLVAITTTSKGSGGRVAADVLIPFASFARRRHKQTIPGMAATFRLAAADLDGFFYFASPGTPVDTSSLHLVAAEVDKDKELRILGATLSSVTGGQAQEQNAIPIMLKVTKVPGLYRITVTEPLPKGEYAIVLGQFGQARTFALQDVWDFGLD